MTNAKPVLRPERSRDLERLLTFVDAIVAVAITLLVLPLVQLATGLTARDNSVGHLLAAHVGQFYAFALSFAVISQLWLAQHRLLRTVIAGSRTIRLWLMLWSLSVVFLPFPTVLLPQAGDQAATKVLYIGTLIVNVFCLHMLASTIKGDSSLRDADSPPSTLPSAVFGSLLVVALVASLTVPWVEYYSLLLLLASDAVVAIIVRVRGKSDPHPPQ